MSPYVPNFSFHRVVLLTALAMFLLALKWSTDFAGVHAGKVPGADLALIIGAIFGPVTALLGFAFNTYSAARGRAPDKTS